MSDHFYSATLPGVTIGGVAKGTATASTNFELRVTDGVTGNSKTEVLKAIEALFDFIVADSAPA
jgi:hypothetical protein